MSHLSLDGSVVEFGIDSWWSRLRRAPCGRAHVVERRMNSVSFNTAFLICRRTEFQRD